MQTTSYEQMHLAVATWRTTVAVSTAQYGSDCPVRGILDTLGDKWSMLVVLELSDGEVRFNQLRRRIPDISQKMLTQTLRGLQRNGMVGRTVHPTVPPSVDYWLTPVGRSLLEPFGHLIAWANSNRTAIVEARASFDTTAAA